MLVLLLVIDLAGVGSRARARIGTPLQRRHVDHETISPEMVRRGLQELIEQTQADEIIATAQIYDHTARLRSFEIAAEQLHLITTMFPAQKA